MFDHINHRILVLVVAACASLSTTVVLEVHAGARARGLSAAPTPSAPASPTLPPGRPRMASAQNSPHVVATNARCGQVLTASLTLNGDLFCTSGTGLTITGNNVVLNLAGHQIDGASRAGDGVLVQGNSDTVENGVISNFPGVGVYVYVRDNIGTPTGATVSAVRTLDNFIGISDGGTNSKITNDTMTGNKYGVYAFGISDIYSGDRELNNTEVGLDLGGTAAVVSSNVADGNAAYGIWDIFATGTTLTKNTANFNGNDGILIQSDPTVVDGGGNLAKGNDYTAGTTPEQCNGVVCT